MQINNVSMIGFKANPVNKAANMATDVAGSVTRRTNLMGDVITSTGCDSFVIKNFKGEDTVIRCMTDAVIAAGKEISDIPDTISKTTENFVQTKFGKMFSMRDFCELAERLKI